MSKTEEFIELLKQNPTLPVVPMVEGEVVAGDMKESRKEIIDLLEELKSEMEHNVLDTLSDGGDDWYTAEKVNECLDIIDRHIKEYTE